MRDCNFAFEETLEFKAFGKLIAEKIDIHGLPHHPTSQAVRVTDSLRTLVQAFEGDTTAIVCPGQET
jgi:hypothetical protein